MVVVLLISLRIEYLESPLENVKIVQNSNWVLAKMSERDVLANAGYEVRLFLLFISRRIFFTALIKRCTILPFK